MLLIAWLFQIQKEISSSDKLAEENEETTQWYRRQRVLTHISQQANDSKQAGTQARLNTPAADSPYIHYRQHIYQSLLSHLIRELKDMFTGKGSTNEMIV